MHNGFNKVMACVFNNGWRYFIPPRTTLFQILYNGYNFILTCRYNGHTTWVTLHVTRWRPIIWWNIFRQIGSNIHKKWIEAFCNAFFIITHRVIDIKPRAWQIILIHNKYFLQDTPGSLKILLIFLQAMFIIFSFNNRHKFIQFITVLFMNNFMILVLGLLYTMI